MLIYFVTKYKYGGGIMASDVSKSWFCVLNNPRKNGYDIEDNNELLETIAFDFITTSTTRSCALTLCVSAEGLEHVHAVFEDVIAFRFSALKKLFPAAHIEATKGNKKQAEDYINKVGSFAEKGEIILCKFQHGDIKGKQGQRSDLSEVSKLLDAGYKPAEIFELDIRYRRFDKIIRDEYFDRSVRNAPLMRDVYCEWHFGATGTGKSYTYIDLCNIFGKDDVYVVNDYDSGFLDTYSGQKILFLDEFRCQIPYSKLLSMLDCYVREFHARYSNVKGLWQMVYIASPYSPEQCYKNLVSMTDNHVDALAQLMRRINKIVYHFRDKNVGYDRYDFDTAEYVSAEAAARNIRRGADGFYSSNEAEQVFLK